MNNPRPKSLQRQSDRLAADVDAFLKSGNKIEQLPMGATGHVPPKKNKKSGGRPITMLRKQNQRHADRAKQRNATLAAKDTGKQPLPDELVEDVRLAVVVAEIPLRDTAIRNSGMTEARRTARNRILSAALFSLGAPRTQIAQVIGYSTKYVNEYLRRINDRERIAADNLMREFRRRLK